MVVRETYLKTQQLADALGVSPSSVKRWVDKGAIEATRTMGKHRLVALASALKFAKDRNYPTDNLLALSGLCPIPVIDEQVVGSLVEALGAGQAREASAIISSAFFADRDAVALADDLIRPAMGRIGHLWMVGAWEIYQEHQATQVVVGALTDLIRRVSRDGRPGRPLALGAAPEGDIYTIPTLLGELVLLEGGWDVRNLGSHLPLRSMAAAVRRHRPALAFLSVSVIVDRARLLQEYSYLYEAATQVGASIIVGGRGVDSELRSRLIHATFGDDMAHLADLAHELLPTSGETLDASPNHPEPMDRSS